jgi:hypothetical protein
VCETTQGIFTPLDGEVMHWLVDKARTRRWGQWVTARMSTTQPRRPTPPPPPSTPQQPVERELTPHLLSEDFRRFQARHTSTQRPDHVVPETPLSSPPPTVRVFARGPNEPGFIRVAPPTPVEGHEHNNHHLPTSRCPYHPGGDGFPTFGSTVWCAWWSECTPLWSVRPAGIDRPAAHVSSF